MFCLTGTKAYKLTTLLLTTLIKYLELRCFGRNPGETLFVVFINDVWNLETEANSILDLKTNLDSTFINARR